MKAMLGTTVLAEADRDELISIEGNWYFPPERVRSEHLVHSPTPYACPWKGACQYLAVQTGDAVLADRAWRYPDPYPAAIQRVGRDFSNYVAFWKEVRVVD
ncbi:DUF427 domain-containing protein [Agromyces bauzanensis]